LSDAPLFAWGDALRAARLLRRRRRRWIAAISTGVALIGFTIAIQPRPRLVWNASASAPIGFYYVTAATEIAPGNYVIARPPERFRALANERQYLPANVPLVKRIVGIGGDDICASGNRIWLDGHPIAHRRSVDGAGRPMPWWTGCVRLRGRQVFLLMTGHPSSFDGRYFGITQPKDVIGEARPLWVG
jgi:conjugative transfer signal peptidase TraF